MKVLFCTQTMDNQDPSMGFFQSWVKYFASGYEKVTVFCLYKGLVSLPKNVSVFSLGKEKYHNLIFRRLVYISCLLYLSFKYRKCYDVVFVHMNKEYILVGGLLWKLLRKPICMWYNHYDGSCLTDIAAFLCNRIFYTSRFAYTTKYHISVQMPVGVDITKFRINNSIKRKPNSLLFLGRITASKRLDVFVTAFMTILKNGYVCSASVYGPTISPIDEDYLKKWISIVDNNHIADKIIFYKGISNKETSLVYASHSIFINCSKSGMYDKTLFEAAASGCIVITSSEDFRVLAGDEHYFDISKPDELVNKIISFFTMSSHDLELIRIKMTKIANSQSLDSLSKKIRSNLQSLL